MTSNRTFQETKRALVEFDEDDLATIVRAGREALAKQRKAYQRGEISELAVEVTEVSQQLIDLGFWVVQREQQSRRN